MAKGIERIKNIRSGMLQRCENPKDKSFPHYGGRGISVCEEWHDPKQFEKWALSHGYADNLSIDRIDNEKGYEPSNCRWATNKEQANNKRDNNRIIAFGISHTTKEWSELLGMDRKTLKLRLKRGMTPEETVTRPLMKNGEIYKTLNPIENVNDQECFNGYVRKSLKHFNITQKVLGEYIGISRESVRNKLSGSQKWKEKEKITIYKYFGKKEFLEANYEMLARRNGG